MEKKSRGEMLLALFLYTFECFSVVSFSALMYQFYHFKSYKDFLQNFVAEHMSFLSFLPEGIPGFYGVVIGLLLLVKTYLTMFSTYLMEHFAGDCSGSLLWAVDPDLLPAPPSSSHNVLGAEGGQTQSKEFLNSLLRLFLFSSQALLELFARGGSQQHTKTISNTKPCILQQEHLISMYFSQLLP